MLETIKHLLQEKKFEQAKVMLLDLAKKYPDDAEINFYCASTHDVLGFEKEAIPFYEKAILFGIQGELREKTFIQLGSSYRCIGDYYSSRKVLSQGLREFPSNMALQSFLALTLYNLNKDKEAVSLLIKSLATASSDDWIKQYSNALKFYAENLDETW